MTELPKETRRPQKIREVMIAAPYSVQKDHALAVAAKLMEDKHIRHLPVFENRKLIGILSEGDLISALRDTSTRALTVAAAVKEVPVVAAPGDSLRDVVGRMVAARSDIAFVVDGSRLVGVFTTIDALKILVSVLATDPDPEVSR